MELFNSLETPVEKPVETVKTAPAYSKPAKPKRKKLPPFKKILFQGKILHEGAHIPVYTSICPVKVSKLHLCIGEDENGTLLAGILQKNKVYIVSPEDPWIERLQCPPVPNMEVLGDTKQIRAKRMNTKYGKRDWSEDMFTPHEMTVTVKTPTGETRTRTVHIPFTEEFLTGQSKWCIENGNPVGKPVMKSKSTKKVHIRLRKMNVSIPSNRMGEFADIFTESMRKLVKAVKKLEE